MKRSFLLYYSVAALALSAITHAVEWHEFTDTQGRTMEAEILVIGEDRVTVKLKANGREVTIPHEKLSKKTIKFLNNYESNQENEDSSKNKESKGRDRNTSTSGELTTDNDIGDKFSKRLYPKSKQEIRTTVAEIFNRKPSSGIDEEIQQATNLLNVYRYLCNVSYNVKPDKKASENATDAANACKENGGLSHKLGHSTDKCNLSLLGDIVNSPMRYILDPGEKNRKKRGHRAWCLNPPMGIVGFGSAGDRYSAMWCTDMSGRAIKGTWSYPGHGLFPLKYMHSNAWSVYSNEKVVDVDKLEIEVFRLNERPSKPLSQKGEINGEKLKINYVALAELNNGINFEPEPSAEPGIYWVRVNGDGVRIGYLVELY